MRPRVLIAEAAGFSPDALSRLRQFADVTTGDLSRDELMASVRNVDIGKLQRTLPGLHFWGAGVTTSAPVIH